MTNDQPPPPTGAPSAPTPPPGSRVNGWLLACGCFGALALVVIGGPILLLGSSAVSGIKDCWEATDGRDLANLPEAALVPPMSELDGPPWLRNEECGGWLKLAFGRQDALFEQTFRTEASKAEAIEFYMSQLQPRWQQQETGLSAGRWVINRGGFNVFDTGSGEWAWVRNSDRIVVSYGDGKVGFRLTRNRH